MKLYVLSEYLQKTLPFVNKAISSHSQLPVLQNIFFQARNGKLKISATDLEIGIDIKITANIEEEGETTIPAKSFSELINTLPQEKILIETNDKNIIITTKHTKSVFQTISSDEFPKLYEEKGERVGEIKKDLFQKTLLHVLFSASIDTSRPALSGIYIKREEESLGKKFYLVATDGYRLSLIYNQIPFSLEKPLLVSARALREAAMVKNNEDTLVKMFVIEKTNQVLFEQGDTIIVGRLLEAQFPEYEKIIPQDILTKAIFDKTEMEKAVKMCAIFARESANIVRLSLKKDSIVVSANAPQTGENTVEVEAKITGEDNDIAFNARYLLDLFANIEEQDLVFEMTTATSPGVFKIKGDSSFLHLIMPIRVQTE